MNDLPERLRKQASDAVDWDGEIMKEWDKIRGTIETRKGSDLPRRMFESLIDNLTEHMFEAADRIERLEAAQETALGYATRFLEHFVNEHCSPVPDWKPLPDLLGVLTQIDNSTTIARDYKARIEALETALHDIASSVAVSNAGLKLLAREALDEDDSIGCGKSVIEPWNDK